MPVRVRGSVFLRGNLQVAGQVSFVMGRIEGDLQLWVARFDSLDPQYAVVRGPLIDDRESWPGRVSFHWMGSNIAGSDIAALNC